MNLFLSAIVSIVISVGSFFGLQHEQQNKPLTPQMQEAISSYVEQSQQAPSFGTTLPIAGATYNLSGAGVSQTATSITLASFTVPQNGYKIQDADLSSTFYITLEPGNSTRQEIVSCTTSVQNSNGSNTFSGCVRGLSPISPYTASSSLQFSHGGGSQVIFSNPPQLFNEYAAKQNTETITGSWTFSAIPSITNNAVQPTDAVNYQTLLNTSISGAGTSTESSMGIVQLATKAQTAAGTASSTQGRPLVIKNSQATTTYNPATAVNVIPVTDSGGTISNQFIATSTGNNYSWGGNQSFTAGLLSTASSTFTATTSIAANSTTTRALILNGIPCSFPSTLGASSSVLTIDGVSCAMRWLMPSIQPVSTTTSFAGPTSSGGQTSKSVFCVAPKIAISGGWDGIPAQTGTVSVVMGASAPRSGLTGWDFTANCNGATCTSSTINVYAICVNP